MSAAQVNGGRGGQRPTSAANTRPASAAKKPQQAAPAPVAAVASPAVVPAKAAVAGPQVPNDNKVSKMLSQVLRHKATELGLKVRADGFTELSGVLELPDFKKKNVTLADVTRVVSGNDKQRFELKTENGVQIIRAAQGHSLKEISSDELLTPVTDAKEWPVCVHGTQFKLWDTIRRSGGLKRMARVHIHFASAPIGVAVSGMRPDSDLFFHLDIPTALAAGLKLYVSSNKILLTEGLEGGMIPLKLFSRIERMEEGKLVDVPFDKNQLPEEKKPQPKQPKQPKQQPERKWANAAAGITATSAPTPAAATPATAPVAAAPKPKKGGAPKKSTSSPSIRPLNSKLSATAPAWSPASEASTTTVAAPVVVATSVPVVAATPVAAVVAAPAKTTPPAKSAAKQPAATTAPIKKAPAVGTAAAIAAAAVAATTPAAVVAPVVASAPTAASIVAAAAPLPFVVAGQQQPRQPLGPPKKAAPKKELVPQPPVAATPAKKPAGPIGVTEVSKKLLTPSSEKKAANVNTNLCPYDYIAVFDFEATCDDKTELPVQEIIEFPIAMVNTRTLRTEYVFHSYVRPEKVPKLTPFCVKFTGISQATVDAAPTFDAVFDAIRTWLQANDFIDENGATAPRPILTVAPPPPVAVQPAASAATARESAPVRGAWAAPKVEKKVTATPTPAETAAATPAAEAKNTTTGGKKLKTFAFASCGDWDLKTMLPSQLATSGISPSPSYFNSWINIKKVFQAHQKATGKRFEPKMGMTTMLDAFDLKLEGHHHSGIDDVKNLIRVVTRILKDNVTPFDLTWTDVKKTKAASGAAANGGNSKAQRKAALNAAAKAPKVQNVIAPPIGGALPSAPQAAVVVAPTKAAPKSAASVVAATTPAVVAATPAPAPVVVAAPVAPVKTAASVVAAANAAALAAAAAKQAAAPAVAAVATPAPVAAKKSAAVVAESEDDGWTKASSAKVNKRGKK